MYFFFYKFTITTEYNSLKKSTSNTQLLILLKNGDTEAFDTIYHKYCHRLHNFALRYLKQKEDAEGIVQEVFIKIWNYRENINTDLSFESFLFKTTYNDTISLLRKRVSEKKSNEYLKTFQQISNTEDIIDEMHYEELTDKLHTLLDQLTPRQKEIYLLSREEGLSHKEIAQQLNISSNTVKNHLVTILKFLRINFNNNLPNSVLFLYLFIQ